MAPENPLDKSRQNQYRAKVAEGFPANQVLFGYNNELGGGQELSDADKANNEKYRARVARIVKNIETLKKDFPADVSATAFRKKLSLRYGQNPGSPAAFFSEEGAYGPNMSDFLVIQEGKGLGYINIGDMDLGQRLVKKLNDVFCYPATCAVIKHEIPSGVGMGKTAREAFERAWYCDSLSAFGSVDVFSSTVDTKTAKLLVEPARNVEVVYAPRFTPNAIEILKKREPMRVVEMKPIDFEATDNGLEYKRVAGGLLSEKRFDTKVVDTPNIDCISLRKPTADEVEAAIFNWIVAAHTRSNAVVIGTKKKTHGIGSGQMSRIDSAHMAIYKANGREGATKDSYGAPGTVMASDAFMPATDVVELAAKNCITAIIYPLGSNKDKEVLEAANDYKISMLITRKPGSTEGGERCFLHR